MRHLAENCVSDADVDAFGSPYSDQLGHLNIVMVMVAMVMMVVMVMMVTRMVVVLVTMVIITVITKWQRILGTHGIEESEACVRQVVDQNHLIQDQSQKHFQEQDKTFLLLNQN